MALFFRTNQVKADRLISQDTLSAWRMGAIPASYAVVTVPIGLPFTVEYVRHGKKFKVGRYEIITDFLAPNGKVLENKLTKEQKKALRNLELPELDASAYPFIKSFKLKGVVTCAASKTRLTDSPELVYDKATKSFEMPTRSLPAPSTFIDQMLEKPTFYVYDVDKQILNPMHPLLDIMEMSNLFVTARHDQNGILYARMDMTSAFGFKQWADTYLPRVRKGHAVMISVVGGKNLWTHAKYVVCMSVNNDRAALLTSEK